MSEQNYILHNSEKCFGKRSEQQYIKDRLGGSLVNSCDAVKKCKKSEHKWKKYLKAPKKQNKLSFQEVRLTP